MLPGLVPRQVVKEVLAEVLELRSDGLEVEEEHPHVVGSALLAVFARLLRARALRGLGLGGNQEGKDTAVFSVPGMIRAIIGAELNRPRGPDVVEVDGAVAGTIASATKDGMCRLARSRRYLRERSKRWSANS